MDACIWGLSSERMNNEGYADVQFAPTPEYALLLWCLAQLMCVLFYTGPACRHLLQLDYHLNHHQGGWSLHPSHSDMNFKTVGSVLCFYFHILFFFEVVGFLS